MSVTIRAARGLVTNKTLKRFRAGFIIRHMPRPKTGKNPTLCYRIPAKLNAAIDVFQYDNLIARKGDAVTMLLKQGIGWSEAPPATIESVREALGEIRKMFGSVEACKIIKEVGGRVHLSRVPPKKYRAILEACHTRLAA
jgi:hypothetical protein